MLEIGMLIFEFFLGLLIGTAIGVFAKMRTGLHPLILLGILAITYIIAEISVDILLTESFAL